MATITPLTLNPLSESYGSATAGQTVTPATPAGGGDNVMLSGAYTIIRFETTGTGTVVTLDSVELSNFGGDVNITVTLAATAISVIAIKGDPRFKQPTVVPGSVALSYTSVVGMNVEAYALS